MSKNNKNKNQTTTTNNSTTPTNATPDNKTAVTSDNTTFDPTVFINDFKLKWTNAWGEVGNWTREIKENQSVKCVNDFRKKFVGFFCHPLASTYRQLPQNITETKFSYIDNYREVDRLLGLNLLTMVYAIGIFKRYNDYPFATRALKGIKGSVLMYLLGGLIIAPEIYNPLIKSDF